MKQVRKFMLTQWLMNTSIYTIIYLFKSFAQWEFRNPFQWIIDIPTYSSDVRGLGLIFFLFLQGLLAFYIWDTKYND